jgi:hypothetical protein
MHKYLVTLKFFHVVFLIILLAYNHCAGGYIVIFTYVLTIYLRFTPSIILTLPLTPSLSNLNFK